MRAEIEKETALIMYEIVLVIILVVFVRNIHDYRQTVNAQYSCDNKVFLYYTPQIDTNTHMAR